MKESLLIEDVKLLTPSGILNAEVAIVDGVVAKIGKHIAISGLKRLNAQGKLGLPGLIDVHVHLRGLNLAYKEDYYSGTCAASAGGFTTVLDMPNTIPPTDSPERLETKIREAGKESVTNVGFHALPPKKWVEADTMAAKGIKSFKLYMGDEKYVDMEFIAKRLPLLAMKSARYGIPLTVHAEHSPNSRGKAETLKAGGFTVKTYASIHSPISEAMGVKLMCDSAWDAKIHFCHLSSAEALTQVKECRETRKDITCEVTPHHLFLTEKDLEKMGPIALTNPPFRGQRSRLTLWEALAKGEVQVVASDHAPHRREEKEGLELTRVPPGIPGLETTLPLMLDAVNKELITLRRLVEVLAENPARIFNLKRKGRLEVGFDGDVTIVDLKSEHVVDSSKFYSKAKYTPFDGWRCRGRPWAAVVAGQVVMKEGEVTAERGVGNVIVEA
ncbi:MAG: dihydroorotase family protein [Candidatus Bathyarchaeia archaeon]